LAARRSLKYAGCWYGELISKRRADLYVDIPRYEGEGEVQMGGTWQVTVLATKNDQTIAQKQFSVTAEGGM
jgi:hypothetical protein